MNSHLLTLWIICSSLIQPVCIQEIYPEVHVILNQCNLGKETCNQKPTAQINTNWLWIIHCFQLSMPGCTLYSCEKWRLGSFLVKGIQGDRHYLNVYESLATKKQGKWHGIMESEGLGSHFIVMLCHTFLCDFVHVISPSWSQFHQKVPSISRFQSLHCFDFP